MSYPVTWETDEESRIKDQILRGNFVKALYDTMLNLVSDTFGSASEMQESIRMETIHREMDSGTFMAYQRLMMLERQRRQWDVYYPTVGRKLESFRALEADWDTYEGVPPSEETIDYGQVLLLNILRLCRRHGKALPEPLVFPGGDGAIQFEWKSDGKALELEFVMESGVPVVSYLVCPSENMEDWLEGEYRGEIPDSCLLNMFLDWL